MSISSVRYPTETDISAHDDTEDSELLDLLQAQHDASLLQHMDRDAAAATAAMATVTAEPLATLPPRSAAETPHQSSPANPPATATQLLVGGSLFSPRRPRAPLALSQGRSAPSQRTGMWLWDARGRRGTVGTLAVGSLYCPFTQQFVSLHSPHWHHLLAVGFGLDASARVGRRMVLLHPGKLYRLACELQGCDPTFAHRGAAASVFRLRGQGSTAVRAETTRAVVPTGSTCAEDRQRQAQMAYATRGWSPLLMGSLGALLESAPTADFRSFYESVRGSLEEVCDPLRARTIDLCYIPFSVSAASAQSARGWPAESFGRTESLAWQSLLAAMGPSGSPTLSAPSASSEVTAATGGLTACGRDRLGAFGDGFLRSAAAWRRHILQRLPKSALTPPPLFPEAAGQGVIVCVQAAASAEGAAGAEAGAMEEDAGIPVRRPIAMLPGLPADTRVAAVVLPALCEHAEPEWDAEMRAAVGAILRQVREAVAATPAARDVRLYWCPVEHSVDYNSVVDLVAFPVPPNTAAAADTDGAASCVVSARERPVPLLSLGLNPLHGSIARDPTPPTDAVRRSDAPPCTIVVVSNAHLLSRRAVGRLLDQWTRNGAAQRSLVAHHRRGAPLASAAGLSGSAEVVANAAVRLATVRWRLLLRADPLTSATRIRYTHPFGYVQALLVSHDCTRAGSAAEGGRADSGASAPLKSRGCGATLAHPPRPAELAAGKDVFHLGEPLSAALLRLAATGGRASRVSLLRTVSKAAARQLPATLVLQQLYRKTTSSGRRVFQEVTVPLQSARGRRLFVHACEAVMDSQDGPREALADGHRPGPAPRAGGDMLSTQRVEDVLRTYPFLTRVQCQHRLVSRYMLSWHSRAAASVAEPSTAAPALPPPPDAAPTAAEGSVVMVPVSSALALRVREEAAHDTLLRLARGTVLVAAARSSAFTTSDPSYAVNTRPVLEQRYRSLAEPPVLLGWWTDTALFCAPAVADVMPLRQCLQDRLAAEYTHDPAGESVVARWDGLEVVDVVIYHVDYVVFPLDRRCRLYGCRALLQRPDSTGDERSEDASRGGKPTASAGLSMVGILAEAFERLHALLKQCAMEAVFFPLWTYHVLPRSHAPAFPSGSGGARSPWCGAAVKGFHFAAVDEWLHPCTPNLVARRLFALEAAQRGPLRLVIGSHIVLYRDVELSASSEVRAGCDGVVVPRGTVCRVEGFVRAAEVVGGGGASVTAAGARRPLLPASLHTSARARRVMQWYVEQQREAVALPVLRAIKTGDGGGGGEASRPSDVEFVLTPQPSLVGGYRSLHYYAMPVLHLPVHVLVPDTEKDTRTPPHTFFRNRLPQRLRGRHARSRDEGTGEGTNGLRPRMCYAVKQLLHPYYTDPDTLAVLLLRPHQRRAAFAALLRPPPPDIGGGGRADCAPSTTDVDVDADPFALVEDMIMGAEEMASVPAPPNISNTPAASIVSAGAEVESLPQMSPPRAGGDTELPAGTLSCPVLTMASLYPDTEEEE